MMMDSALTMMNSALTMMNSALMMMNSLLIMMNSAAAGVCDERAGEAFRAHTQNENKCRACVRSRGH